MRFWQTTMAWFAEAPRPLRIACFVLVFFLAFALIEVIALLAFGRKAVVNFDEHLGIIGGTFILSLLLAALPVGLYPHGPQRSARLRHHPRDLDLS